MRWHKKLLPGMVAIVAVLICFFLLPTEANAETDGCYTYNVVGGKAHISDCDTSISGAVTIPATLGGYPVAYIGMRAFEYCTNLTSVTIPNGVLEIGQYAFANCSNLASITIPDSVTSIDSYAFRNCSSLDNISIPNSVTRIGMYTFDSCNNLTSITIPDSVTYIGQYAFSECRNLVSVAMSNNVTIIESYTFQNCTSLNNITIGERVSYIGNGAFRGCSALTSITIPDGVTRIDSSAFTNCSGLMSIVFPDSIATISSSAFSSCSKLWHILYTGNQAQWGSIEIGEGNGYLTQAIQHYNCAGSEELNLTRKYCSICSANCSHNWDNGTITKESSCKEPGSKILTCATCNEEKTETLDKLETHTYDDACDAECNVCGGLRTVSHQYSTEWVTTETNHWHECSICGVKKDYTPHTAGAIATETAPQTCVVCGYVIKTALGHTHTFGASWVRDADNHWKECACGTKSEIAAHNWENGLCSICGASAPSETQPTEPAPSAPTEPAPTEPVSSTPTNPVNDGNNEQSQPPIWIFVAIGIVCLAGGAAGGVIISKKKQ